MPDPAFLIMVGNSDGQLAFPVTRYAYSVSMSARPEILFPLFSSVTKLPGIGPRLAKLVEKLTGPHVVDLLWHLPAGCIDRRYEPKIRDAEPGKIGTLLLSVEEHIPSSNRRLPWKVLCRDETGFLHLTFFNGNADWLKRTLPIGSQRYVSGRVDEFRGERQISHPDFIVAEHDRDSIPEIEPVYGLTAGLQPKTLRKAINGALEMAPEGMPEWHDPHILQREQWPAWKDALLATHHPEDEDSLSPHFAARKRLAYDELLANQLALALVRARQKQRHGKPWKGDGQLRHKVENALPFTLTAGQMQALSEIYGDQASPAPMLRLLQGDVGSGKTIVALLSLLNVVECGSQGALMAPTEILARQHYDGLKELCDQAGVTLAVLTGRDKGKDRQKVLDALAAGDIDILVGTHALFQQDVVFQDLGLAIVDEQHRFGVHQRMELASKGATADVLVMTATPIPRTLTLTAYGDMDVSRLTDKPPGRKPVETRVMESHKLDDIKKALGRQLEKGGRVYWVCPLVEESEKIDLVAAEDRYEDLQQLYGDQVGLVHGKMKAADKDAVMARFVAGEISILVATTVIEVGVNVPEATVMIIEQAERFGLAQLHQLRGRVGRGAAEASCLLLYKGKLSDTARSRLAIMRDSEDGFLIAEEDLRLRGGGEMLGTRQSGLPEYRLASLVDHADLLLMARDDARYVTDQDPDLLSDRGKALRCLLYLFERDEGVRYLRSG